MSRTGGPAGDGEREPASHGTRRGLIRIGSAGSATYARK